MNHADAFSLWAYLSASPLLWLTATLVAWLAADGVSRLCGRSAFVNPVALAILFVALMLKVTDTPYSIYFSGAQFVHFLLGPATVALAVPLFRNWDLVRRNIVPMGMALLVGSCVAVGSAVGFALLLDLPVGLIVSLAPKSVTAAVAMGISQELGGDPSLTAVLCIATGIIGAVTVTPLMTALRIRNNAATGFAVGLTSHGIGTARAFSVDPVAGSFAGIAMALNAVVTALLLSPLMKALDV